MYFILKMFVVVSCAGTYRGGHAVLVRAKLALSSEGIAMQLTVRSTDPHVSEVIASAVG